MERHSGVPQASRVLAATRSPRKVSDLIVSRQEKDDWMTTQITRKIINSRYSKEELMNIQCEDIWF